MHDNEPEHVPAGEVEGSGRHAVGDEDLYKVSGGLTGHVPGALPTPVTIVVPRPPRPPFGP